ncbi:MAG: hypothetical protein KDD66_05420 [Bdellovibrionales bacterium]|nr:hypothetical protein [Bdellovibrionales bacterium]
MDKQYADRSKMLQAMIRPLARLCVRFSIALPEILEELKRELVRAAHDELREQDSKITVSKLNAMTGVTRREINRISEEDEPSEMKQSLLARVINRWQQNEQFLTRAGKPKLLSYKGENSEFRRLVDMVSKDTNAPAMLFEMKRIGAVEETSRGLKLLTTESVLRNIPERSLNLLYRNVDSLVRAAEENLTRENEERYYYLRTEFDNIPSSKIEHIRAWLLEKGKEFHKEARSYLAGFDRDLSVEPIEDGSGRAKVVVGGYSAAEVIEEVSH